MIGGGGGGGGGFCTKITQAHAHNQPHTSSSRMLGFPFPKLHCVSRLHFILKATSVILYQLVQC